MDEMADVVRQCAVDVLAGADPSPRLLDAAKAWAAASLDVYSGGLLKKALGVSAALAEFAAEYAHAAKAP